MDRELIIQRLKHLASNKLFDKQISETFDCAAGIIEKGTGKETEKAVLKEIENIELEYSGVSYWYVTEDCRCTVSHWDNYCRNCGRRLVWK